MKKAPRKKPGPPKKPKLKASQIRGAKYLDNFMELLTPLHDHCHSTNRKLRYDQYIAYLLLYYFTPTLTSMRGLQQASNFKQIQKKLKLARFSLGSFSEAGRVFDPKLLEPIIEQLAGSLSPLKGDPRLADIDLAITAVDGTLLHAIPKMAWALWQDDQHRGAKMQLQYNILKGVPTKASITPGNAGECTVLNSHLEAGHLYVLDRGFANHALLARIIEKKSSFVIRIKNEAVYEIIEERPISQAHRNAGIQKDIIVKLGSKSAPELHDKQIRLVEVEKRHASSRPNRSGKKPASQKTNSTDKPDGTLLIATDLLYLDVDVISELYRSRWQIEIFFRWFKKVLGADRPLSLSQNGFTIIAYCALIASLLITLWTGRKPTKRTYEMICFYFSGWITQEELSDHIASLAPAKA